MADTALRHVTFDDLVDVPSHQVAELINGQLVTSPRLAPAHARVSSSLGGELHGPFDRGRGGPGGWIILDEPELHLGGDVLVPDIAGWRRERMPSLPQTSAFELAPDWVCEVLSPSTAAVDRTAKLPIYARERVTHVWLIDPTAQTLEALRLDGDSYRIIGAVTTFGWLKVRAGGGRRRRPLGILLAPAITASEHKHPWRCLRLRRNHHRNHTSCPCCKLRLHI